MDPAANPCDDFYRYACGGWVDRTEIPPDRPAWSRLAEMEERNREVLRGLLDAAASRAARDSPEATKLGDYWSACMDEDGVEARGTADLAAVLETIAPPADSAALARVLGLLHRQGVFAAFSFDSTQDLADATKMIGEADRAGMGLPDRDYYLSDDPKMKAIREEYVPHVARTLALSGLSAEAADAGAAVVMRIETSLAQASLRRVDRRDPKNVYHRLDLAGLESLAPEFPWEEYIRTLGRASVTEINVTEPEFFRRLNELTRDTPGASWATYLRWHLLRAVSPALPRAFVDEDFRFTRVLTGAAQLLPRWKRCAASVDAAMGFAAGRLFVERTFGERGRERALELVGGIESAMGADLDALGWMDDATRAGAKEKLATLGNKIGFPSKWRDYGALVVDRASYLHSFLASRAFEVDRELDKIGRPVDRAEWGMTPQTVNAYYDASMNEMVFPAGILQPPFFEPGLPAASRGAIGMVMGHELTHGFDDEGRQFDAKGDLRDWWTAPAADEFRRRADCVKKQFDGYVAVDDRHVDGALTLGENIADLGGVKLAWTAFERSGAPGAAGFTPAQSFFLGYAQGWCTKRRPEYARMLVAVDPHSPPPLRVDGPLSNFPPFAKAFSCGEGSAMVRPAVDRCEVW